MAPADIEFKRLDTAVYRAAYRVDSAQRRDLARNQIDDAKTGAAGLVAPRDDAAEAGQNRADLERHQQLVELGATVGLIGAAALLVDVVADDYDEENRKAGQAGCQCHDPAQIADMLGAKQPV